MRIALALLFATLAGCGKPPEPAWATSSLPLPEALYLASVLSAEIPGGRVSTVADTRSMVPAMGYNAVLVSELVRVADLRRGDVVVFARDGGTIVHRVIDSGPGWVQTKGDALARADPFRVSDRELVGRVVAQVNVVRR